MIQDQGESVFIIEYDYQLEAATIVSYSSIPTPSLDSQVSQDDIISSLYCSTSDLSNLCLSDSREHTDTPYPTSLSPHQE